MGGVESVHLVFHRRALSNRLGNGKKSTLIFRDVGNIVGFYGGVLKVRSTDGRIVSVSIPAFFTTVRRDASLQGFLFAAEVVGNLVLKRRLYEYGNGPEGAFSGVGHEETDEETWIWTGYQQGYETMTLK